MAYFMTTPLGREVPAGDWQAYGQDQILRLLYEFALVPFNDGTLLYSVASICNATNLDLAPAIQLARDLVVQGFAEEVAQGKFRITQRGVQLVHTLANGFESPL